MHAGRRATRMNVPRCLHRPGWRRCAHGPLRHPTNGPPREERETRRRLALPVEGPMPEAAHFETSTPKDKAAARRVTRKRKYFFGQLTAKARKMFGPRPINTR